MWVVARVRTHCSGCRSAAHRLRVCYASVVSRLAPFASSPPHTSPLPFFPMYVGTVSNGRAVLVWFLSCSGPIFYTLILPGPHVSPRFCGPSLCLCHATFRLCLCLTSHSISAPIPIPSLPHLPPCLRPTSHHVSAPPPTLSPPHLPPCLYPTSHPVSTPPPTLSPPHLPPRLYPTSPVSTPPPTLSPPHLPLRLRPTSHPSPTTRGVMDETRTRPRGDVFDQLVS